MANDAQELSEETAQALGWVVREAATNTLRHSSADACEIKLTTDSESVTLSIRDNGTGTPPEPPGAGLAGMQERVAELDGVLTWDARPDGFTVLAHVPTYPGRVVRSQ